VKEPLTGVYRIPAFLADVEATLELLYHWQREWHGAKMPEGRRREILKAVFKVDGPAA
jgi:hypothetical protein